MEQSYIGFGPIAKATASGRFLTIHPVWARAFGWGAALVLHEIQWRVESEEYATPDGWVTLKLSKWAEILVCSERTARKAIADLVTAEVVEEAVDNSHFSNRTKSYRVDPEMLEESLQKALQPLPAKNHTKARVASDESGALHCAESAHCNHTKARVVNHTKARVLLYKELEEDFIEEGEALEADASVRSGKPLSSSDESLTQTNGEFSRSSHANESTSLVASGDVPRASAVLDANMICRLMQVRLNEFEIRGVVQGVSPSARTWIEKAWKWARQFRPDDPEGFLADVIRGARRDPFLAGQNSTGKVYDGWDNLLRDASKCETRASNAGASLPKLNRTGRPWNGAGVARIDPRSQNQMVIEDAMRRAVDAEKGQVQS